ncbi:sugar-binding protein [Ligilactobacillus ruminis S23]|uniref:ABC transporter substrate-binding protein n=2 Tax=Ligilactobacillus ruminis TaxID=1623 RepID=UPI00063923AB|nr:extracellular solute-binding protein [Ligilactobacillus ruminis]KLA47649.1 sugar-binding protein [Ligilactobacillus ruminis S23]
MKNSKLKLFLLGAALLLSVGAAAVFYESNKEQTITLGIYVDSSWNVPNSEGTKVIDYAIRRFEKENRGVKIKYESGLEKNDYMDWLSEKIVANKSPDVFIVPSRQFNMLASIGSMAKLDGYIEKEGIDRKIFYDGTYEAGRYSENQYALPYETNPMMMCVNTELMKKEGIDLPGSSWTIEDLYDICQRVSKDVNNDGIVDQFGIADYTWENAVFAYGAKLFGNDGSSADFTSSKVRRALTMMEKLNALSGNYEPGSDDFDKGKVAFLPMTLAQYRTYKSYPYHVAKYSAFSWTCIKMPSESRKICGTNSETSLFAVSSQSHRKKLAWKFVKLLCCDKKVQQYLLRHSQGSTVLRSVISSRQTKRFLEEDGITHNALTTESLDAILNSMRASQHFKKYNDAMGRADYLISKALEKREVDTEISKIQNQLENTLISK